MTNSTSIVPWTLRMAAGSQQEWVTAFTTTAPGGTTPYPISATGWEYVARTSATDTGTPAIRFDTIGNSQGVLTVTATAALSQVLLTMFPAATATLAPGTYYQSLWQYPGTSSAYTWWTGLLLVEGNPQP